jgi:hypothetical protein
MQFGQGGMVAHDVARPPLGGQDISMPRLFIMTLCLLAGCETQRAVTEAAPQIYGQLRQANGSVTPLAQIAADPTRYEGKEIRTEGEIQRVCQKRGCWLELADSSGARVFVPMAGHAFVVPMDSMGERALVEGTVHRRERSDAERNHLKSDGAGDGIPTVSIEANAVVIRSRDAARKLE